MTNTIYFNLDNASFSTSSPGSTLSQQQQGQEPEGSGAAVGESSSSYSTATTAADGINAWISRLNIEEVSNSGNDPNLLSNTVLQPPMLKNFSFKQLKIATRNFHPDFLLGEGGFGRVFKGWIDENTLSATEPGTGTAVAVKRFKHINSGWLEIWLTEIKYLGKLNHLNLVRLLGYCVHKEEHLLVYEFVPQGNLHNHLFRRASNCQLSWSLRLKIALETAKALAYLHSREINVIHRNLTSSNILLDSNCNAKLSGFWASTDGPSDDKTHVSTQNIRGAIGYIDPEYLCTGMSAKSDVYDFGVVLLEILSGQRALDMNRSSKEHIITWAEPYLNNGRKIFRVLDSHLEGQYALESAQKAVHLVIQCITDQSELRPNMDVVVAALEQLQE